MDNNSTARIPDDLIALPSAPWVERPVELPLDVEEARTALWMHSGNVTEAARTLKVTPQRLRSFVKKSVYLTAEMQEAAEQLVDIAESNVREALSDPNDASRRDTMSRFVLSNIGKARGWGTGSNNLNIKNNSGGTIVVQWADGTSFGASSQPEEESVIKGDMIDVTPSE